MTAPRSYGDFLEDIRTAAVKAQAFVAGLTCDAFAADDKTAFAVVRALEIISEATFPFTCPTLAVYASLIDGRGETPLRLRLIDVDESREPVVDFETTVNFLDPTEE